MRILDPNSDKSIENITLYLTLAEASEFRDSLNELLQKPLNNHAHISNDNFKKEITICIYDLNHLEGFNERSKDLILKDE